MRTAKEHRGLVEARRRIWWRSRAPVALYVELAHPTHIAARSRMGADGVGVGPGGLARISPPVHAHP